MEKRNGWKKKKNRFVCLTIVIFRYNLLPLAIYYYMNRDCLNKIYIHSIPKIWYYSWMLLKIVIYYLPLKKSILNLIALNRIFFIISIIAIILLLKEKCLLPDICYCVNRIFNFFLIIFFYKNVGEIIYLDREK